MQSFHGVCANDGHIVAMRVAGVNPQGVGFFSHEVSYLVSDLLSKEQLLWIAFSKGEHEAAIAAANVNDVRCHVCLDDLLVV